VSEQAPPARPITTARLLLSPLRLADAEAIQALFPQWEIVRLLADRVPWPYPADGALTHIRDHALPAMARGEEWHWTLRLKTQPDRVIGAIGLMAGGDTNRGFWIALPWQGRGLMSEASDAVTDFWFDELGREVLRVPKAAANAASRRISERSGMRLVGTETRGYISGPQLTEIWEITREEWRAYRATSFRPG
jgi:[ribosomal protein S5]-alanine N-acetyltransferase